MISCCIKRVSAPFYNNTTVAVFSDGWMPTAHIAKILNANQQTLENKLNGPEEFKHFDRNTSPYTYRRDISPVQNVISKQGLAQLLKDHIGWDAETVQRAMDQLFKDNKYFLANTKIIARKFVMKSTKPEKKEEDDSLSPPKKALSKKRPEREEEKDRFEEKEDVLRAFLDEVRSENASFRREMDQRIGEQATWHYQRSSEFEKRLDATIQKEVDTMLPELRKQMEEKVRRELEPSIREQIKKDLVVQVQQEVEPFRQKLLTQETQKVFSEQVEKNFDRTSFVSDILKKRKLGGSEK